MLLIETVDGTLIWNGDISYGDIHLLESLLQQHDPFVFGFFRNTDDYQFAKYIHIILIDQISVTIMFDRNLFTALVGFALNKRPLDDLVKLACACMAFSIYTDIILEPGMSLHELAFSQGHTACEEEFIIFRALDNMNPRYFLDIALGRRTNFPKNELEKLRQDVLKRKETLRGKDLSIKLKLWKMNYMFVLKLVQLHKQYPTNKKLAYKSFLKWMKEDTFFNAFASVFGAVFLAHYPKSVIKNINSSNNEKLKHGIENATWDLTYLTVWSKKNIYASHPKNYTIFASDDKVLKIIARSTLSLNDNSYSDLEKIFVCYYGKDHKVDLMKFYLDLIKDCHDMKRDEILDLERFPKVDFVISILEKELKI